jgi:hypothetical protein
MTSLAGRLTAAYTAPVVLVLAGAWGGVPGPLLVATWAVATYQLYRFLRAAEEGC